MKSIELLNLALKAFKIDNDEIVEIDNKANKIVVNLFKNNKLRNLMHMPNIKAIKKPIFLIPNAKKVFNNLQLIFIKALILQHFDLKSHIFVETNILSYVIGRMLSQLNLNFDISLNDSNKSDFS